MARVVAVFLHVASGMGVFCAMGMEGIALYQYRRASAAQRQLALNGFEVAHRAAPLTGAATILTGVYLAQTVWGWHAAWINIGLIGVIVVAAVSAITGPAQAARMRAGVQSDEPAFGVSFTTRAGLLLGIVFLMTVKPPSDVSLMAMTVGAVIGFVAGAAPLRRRAHLSASE